MQTASLLSMQQVGSDGFSGRTSAHDDLSSGDDRVSDGSLRDASLVAPDCAAETIKLLGADSAGKHGGKVILEHSFSHGTSVSLTSELKDKFDDAILGGGEGDPLLG